jgi:hypothetical protein
MVTKHKYSPRVETIKIKKPHFLVTTPGNDFGSRFHVFSINNFEEELKPNSESLPARVPMAE